MAKQIILAIEIAGGLAATMLVIAGCSRIPIGPSGKGFFDQCIELDATGINSVSEAGVWNMGSVSYKRNINCAMKANIP